MFKIDVDYNKFNIDTLGVGGVEREVSLLRDEARQEDKDLLYRCFTHWMHLSDWRERRRRSRRYLRGDQWSDLITDPDCVSEKITEKEHIERQGLIAFKNNQIRQIVKNVIGQYRSNETKPVVVARNSDASRESEMMTMAVRYVHQINTIDELDARGFEEFLLGGLVANKVNYRYWKTRNIDDAYVVNVNSNYLFFNTDVKDVRTHDLRLIGEVIDLPKDELIGLFAKTEADRERISGWYAGSTDGSLVFGKGLSADRVDSMHFLNTGNELCRMYEVWELRSEWRMRVYDPLTGSYDTRTDVDMSLIDEANRERIARGVAQGVSAEKIPLIEGEPVFESFWYVKYLTPMGYVLFESETPFSHEEHPYSLLLYPLIDGEVWGFVEDIIDQQRYINRMVTLLDASIGMGMKNLLLIPEDAIPDDMDIADFASEWTKINGVIAYKAKPGMPMPTQLSASSTNMGAHDLLALQMKMIQDISGVHGALQGQAPVSGTPSSLYAQQSQNASLNLLDLFESYNALKQRRDMKILKVIKQYYREKRYLAISGSKYSEEANMYEPDAVRDLDFDLVISQSIDTPVFRQLGDELLMKLFELQAIPVELFLENTSMPMAQNLLQSLESYKEKMQSGGGVPPAMGGQLPGGGVPEGTNPEAMAMLGQMMGGANG